MNERTHTAAHVTSLMCSKMRHFYRYATSPAAPAVGCCAIPARLRQCDIVYRLHTRVAGTGPDGGDGRGGPRTGWPGATLACHPAMGLSWQHKNTKYLQTHRLKPIPIICGSMEANKYPYPAEECYGRYRHPALHWVAVRVTHVVTRNLRARTSKTRSHTHRKDSSLPRVCAPRNQVRCAVFVGNSRIWAGLAGPNSAPCVPRTAVGGTVATITGTVLRGRVTRSGAITRVA